MKILITGASGFVGHHLVRELKQHALTLTSLHRPRIPFKKGFRFIRCDLRSLGAVNRLVKRVDPDAVVHLAGLASVAGPSKRREILRSNVKATENLCRALALSGRERTLLLASSAAVYGSRPGKVSERTQVRPNSPYALSKLAAENAARAFEKKGLRVYVARPFNHTGPGGSVAQVSWALARKVASVTSGGTISIGNLKARRDFSDVRDVVRAYRLIIEQMPSERLFVLGSGRLVAIGKILSTFVKLAGKTIRPVPDRALLRHVDHDTPAADTRLARKILRWSPRISLKKTLADVYREARSTKGPRP